MNTIKVNQNGKKAKSDEQPKADVTTPINPVDEIINEAFSDEAQELKNETTPEKPLAISYDLETTMNRVEVLTDLIERRERLVASLKKLNSFDLSTDNRGLELKLGDGQNRWETTNSAVITSLITGVKAELARKIVEVNSEIRF
jgi:hypothetical protein